MLTYLAFVFICVRAISALVRTSAFLQPVVPGQVYSFEISPPLILRFCKSKFIFGQKKVKTQQQQNNKSNKKSLAGSGNWTRELSQRGCVTSAPPSQLRITIVVKLFNVNNQSRKCGPHISTSFFSAMCLHAWKTILGSFSYLRE